MFHGNLTLITRHRQEFKMECAYCIIHSMSAREGKSSFVLQRVSLFFETKLRETMKIEGTKSNCLPCKQT